MASKKMYFINIAYYCNADASNSGAGKGVVGIKQVLRSCPPVTHPLPMLGRNVKFLVIR